MELEFNLTRNLLPSQCECVRVNRGGIVQTSPRAPFVSVLRFACRDAARTLACRRTRGGAGRSHVTVWEHIVSSVSAVCQMFPSIGTITVRSLLGGGGRFHGLQ